MVIDCRERLVKIECSVKEVVERAELDAIEARRQIGRDEGLLGRIEARRTDSQAAKPLRSRNTGQRSGKGGLRVG
jgi:hypothetical protein